MIKGKKNVKNIYWIIKKIGEKFKKWGNSYWIRCSVHKQQIWRVILREILNLQYDGSKDDLDWRIDFKYLNFIYIIKYLRFRLIKGCFIEWIYLRLLNFNLCIDLIRTSFFKVLTYFIRLGKKFYIILKKNQFNRTIFTSFMAIFNK